MYLSERHSRSMKTLSIHRRRPPIEMRHAGAGQHAGESGAGELAVVGVEDLGIAEALGQLRHSQLFAQRLRVDLVLRRRIDLRSRLCLIVRSV